MRESKREIEEGLTGLGVARPARDGRWRPWGAGRQGEEGEKRCGGGWCCVVVDLIKRKVGLVVMEGGSGGFCWKGRKI